MRILEGPHSALGIGEAVSPEYVRAAFLALTKQFHPAKFGRMSTELQRLSNEVFLGIKSAHDQLMKGLGPSLRPSSSGIPHVQAEGTSRTPADPGTVRGTGLISRQTSGTQPPATQPVQFARGTDRASPRQSTLVPPGTQPGIQPQPRLTPVPPATQPGIQPQPRPTPGMPARAVTPVPPGTQPGVQPRGFTAVPPATQPGVQPAPQRVPLLTPSGGTPMPAPNGRSTSQSIPVARPATPPPSGRTPAFGVPVSTPVARPATPPPSGRTPAFGVQISTKPTQPLARNDSPSTPPRPNPDAINPPTTPPRPNLDAINPPTIRYSGQPTSTQRPAPVFDEQLALAEAMGLIKAQNWTGARQALHALAAKVPQSKQYRALLCYSRGREAHAGGRGDEATLEYQRALQLDPELASAKQALAELQRRRW